MFGFGSTIATAPTNGIPQRVVATRRRIARFAGAAATVAALTAGLSSPASAAATPVSYGSALFCQTLTNSDYSSWQQQLIGATNSVTYETLYAQAPSALAAYIGTAKVVWSGRIVYLAINGQYYYGNAATMSATATTAALNGGRIQYIKWNGNSTPWFFTTNVTPGHSYSVYATTSWINANGQTIASVSGYVPNDNC
jgi:hypothetical protein